MNKQESEKLSAESCHTVTPKNVPGLRAGPPNPPAAPVALALTKIGQNMSKPDDRDNRMFLGVEDQSRG